ncbi:hypothetical protein GI374_12315 [Paracoccus sp. S-4012]|uniref:hypothetical protein n=1 Tax=Paracoccus sp. S-4012 TaxID=2665648 RepID=UPI0012B11A4D|nr:hypothetical protein [Paracoccus sp. S-4012]MRX51215.1 hypothetical protein [Paracoccus sp. S-4012]
MSCLRNPRRGAAAVFAAALALALPGAAFAHGDEVHAAWTLGPNGGLFGSAGDYHVELAPVDGAMTVWLTDIDGAPVPTDGMAATVAVQHDDQRLDLDLVPAGDHMLEVKDERIQPAEGDRLIFQTIAPDGEPNEARFEIRPDD